MQNFDKVLIRASAIHNIMTEPQSKADKEAGNLGATAKSYLQILYREITTGRYHKIPDNKYFSQGNYGEGYALTMLALKEKRMLKQNHERIANEYFIGMPDTYIGESILTASKGFDTKCPFSVFTMPFKSDTLSKQYYYQNMAYMALTGAKEWDTVYCLVNHSLESITKQKTQLWFKLGCEQIGATDEYIKGVIEIEKDCIYNKAEFLKSYPDYVFDCKDWKYDLTPDERIRTFNVKYDSGVIEAMRNKVIKCREYLNELHKSESI